jgi:hypothetical protein
MVEKITVPVQSAWYSKINWTQIGGSALTLATTFAAGLPPQHQVIALVGINLAQSAATMIFRTFFNGTVSPSSL